MIHRVPLIVSSRNGFIRTVGAPSLGTITDLAAIPGNGQIALSWTPAAHATSHQPQYRAQGSGTWLSFGSPLSGTASGVTVTGLTPGTPYEFRVVASDGVSQTFGNVVTATPAAGGVVEPLFADGFESGNASHTQNGFRWNSGGSRVITAHPRTGNYSMWFPFGPTEPDGSSHWWTETRFSHNAINEYWVEYYIWIPANYFHYREHSSNNNKFYAFWTPEGYSASGGGSFQLWAPDNSGVSTINYGRYAPNGPYLEYPSQTQGLIFWAEHHGTWQRIRIHLKISDIGQSNGEAHLWRGDDLIVECLNDENNSPNAATNGYTNGYLMGYDNGRYQEQTDFYIDDFKFYAQDPGWG